MHISNKTILNDCIFNLLKICNFGGRHVIVGISKGGGGGVDFTFYTIVYCRRTCFSDGPVSVTF